jgi:acetyltransferase-like isoleucine patch superfamily enzyme
MKRYFIRFVVLLHKKLKLESIYQRIREDKIKSTLSQFKSVGNDINIQGEYFFINPKYISIGSDFHTLFNLRLEAWDKYGADSYTPEIIIKNNVRFGADCHIGCINKVIIGNNVLIASKVFITDHTHGQVSRAELEKTPLERPLFSLGPVIIEDNVWIGENVVVMPGITIGKNSIIGANAVVTKSVPENSVAVGVPATILRTL